MVAGAIYAKEIGEMIKARRIRPVPYDPILPVHTIWDLGWNDAMAVIMVQQPLPSVVNVINYYEDGFRRYDEVVQLLNSLGYRWDEDWLPHDGESHNPQTGKSPKKTLQELGRKRVKIIGNGKRPDPEHGSGQVRMMFPHVYIDNSTLEHPTGYLGGQRLIDCLSRTARNVPKTTRGARRAEARRIQAWCRCFCGLATIVDHLTNDVERRPRVITLGLPERRSRHGGSRLITHHGLLIARYWCTVSPQTQWHAFAAS